MGKREREEYKGREKWAKHFPSNHQILIVGDGDFSFSLSLATSFASALNITATSLDSYDALTKNYRNARFNLEALQRLGATIIHGVDATRMKRHVDLNMRRFDRIVYNFPHSGFHGKEDSRHTIRLHKRLVREFFHNASNMLRRYGEIHVTHKTSAPFCHWNLKELALQNTLELSESIPFKIKDYPGYNHKRGEGPRIDKLFPLGKCSTCKFVLFRGPKKKSVNIESEKDRLRRECSLMFGWYFNHVRDTFGRPDEMINHNVLRGLRLGHDIFLNNASGRHKRDEFTFYLEEMWRLSKSRTEWLEGILREMR